jgi:hypothetical protein
MYGLIACLIFAVPAGNVDVVVAVAMAMSQDVQPSKCKVHVVTPGEVARRPVAITPTAKVTEVQTTRPFVQAPVITQDMIVRRAVGGFTQFQGGGQYQGRTSMFAPMTGQRGIISGCST